MPDPNELLALARLLSKPIGVSPASDAQLRRAVSTAYYAVFHQVLRCASQRFIGGDQRNRARYTLICRGFNHGKMGMVCEALQVSTMKDRYRKQLGRNFVSPDMRDFAGAFPALQDARHNADYDPDARFSPLNVESHVDAAAFAIEAFGRAPADEQADVLALMLVKNRT